MMPLERTLAEKLRIDEEIAEMRRHPIDYSDIPSRINGDFGRGHFGNERLLRALPPDILRELVRRRLAELEAAGYTRAGA